MTTQKPIPPAPPDTLPETPEFRRSTRYRRPRRYFSWWGLILGILIGIGGAVFYAWNIAPLEEFDTQPRQLSAEAKTNYVIGILLQYRYDGDAELAYQRLVELNLSPDPIQSVADIACNLARSGYVNNNSGLNAVRALMTFYQLQGRAGCADALIPDVQPGTQVFEITVPTPTPTLVPPPSKTPTPVGLRDTPTPDNIQIVPTTPPRRRFSGFIDSTFCDTELSGIIEVFVQDFNGQGVPAQRVRVRWDGGEDSFVTGLKPERGPAYADFQMEDGLSYIVDMPGNSDPISSPLLAEPCTTETGQTAIKSYRVVFGETN